MNRLEPSPVAVPVPDGGAPERVLYLTHRVPFPPDKGDRIRNYHLLRQLASCGRVWLGCLADEPVPAAAQDELLRLCERLAIVPVGRSARWLRAGASLLAGRSLSEGAFAEPRLRAVVRDWAGQTQFTTAVVSASSLAPYLRLPELDRVPRVVDLVDVDSQKWLDFADASRGPRRWLYRLEGARVRKLERGLPGWARAVAVVSRAEADVFDRNAGAGTATVATNGVDLDYFHPHRAEPLLDRPVGLHPSCVFVGAMDYLPNVDGACWFVREVWPLVRARFPLAVFWIVGRSPTAAVRELSGPGVEVVGPVPDVRPYLDAAMVAVVPLRLARGVQNKVLEALAMAKPVVAAPPALAALAAEPGRDLLAATTPAEWVDALGELFSGPARRRDLGASGRRYVEKHHHWSSCLEPLLDAIFAPRPPRHDPRLAGPAP